MEYINITPKYQLYVSQSIFFHWINIFEKNLRLWKYVGHPESKFLTSLKESVARGTNQVDCRMGVWFVVIMFCFFLRPMRCPSYVDDPRMILCEGHPYLLSRCLIFLQLKTFWSKICLNVLENKFFETGVVDAHWLVRILMTDRRCWPAAPAQPVVR